MITKCILGSQSPRRQQLLQMMDIAFEVRVSDIEEDFPADMNIRKVAEYLAEKKAKALLPTLQEGEILLTADSTVICNDKIYNKPIHMDDAIDMLKQLAGKKHEVITGVWIGNQQTKESFSEMTIVEFTPMKDEEIVYYVQKYLPLDKAGAYGIQDWLGATMVKSIQGSYTNVMGLPSQEVYKRLMVHFE